MYENLFKDENGEFSYISVQDFKVNRQKGTEKDNLKYIYVPVTKELEDLLYQMGYEKYKNSDKYILAPEETMRRNTIKLFLSRSFSHYYGLLATGKKLTYGVLRKTYITKLTLLLGIEDAKLITRHSNIKVMDQNYLNKPLISRTGKALSMLA